MTGIEDIKKKKKTLPSQNSQASKGGKSLNMGKVPKEEGNNLKKKSHKEITQRCLKAVHDSVLRSIRRGWQGACVL